MGMILNPKYRNPQILFLKKKAELLNLITERDYYLKTLIPNLKAIYLTHFGELMIKSIEMEHKYLRLKRKIELIQSVVNSQHSNKYKDLEEIEDILHDEYSEWEENIEQMKREQRTAEEWFDNCMSEDESRELKMKYREIVKRLHPDLNPDLTAFEIDLWHKTQDAYQEGDLDELRRIYSLLEDLSAPSEDESKKDIKARIKKLESHIREIAVQMEKLKQEFPLSIESMLNSKELIEKEKEKFEGKLNIYKDRINTLEFHLSNLEALFSDERSN